MIDSHSHTKLSHDGKVDIINFVKEASNRNFEYLAITEHYDRDYKYCFKEFFCHQLNLSKYNKKFNEAKCLATKTYIAKGLECGYHKKAISKYMQVIPKMELDVVINSVHTLFGGDAYLKGCFKNRSIQTVYDEYLDLLYESLLVPYDYHIIGHIGYITRYAPYENSTLCQPQFYEKIDKVLNKIIELDKTLEVNTHINNTLCTPEDYILKRYFTLGGRRITFSSDAHDSKLIGDKYQQVCDKVKAIGFTHWTIYKKGIAYEVII